MSATRTEARMLEHAFREVPLPDDITDESRFPEMAAARRHLASLSPERRAELNAGWVS